MRLQYTVNDYLFEVWPLDGWSRKVILQEVQFLGLEYIEQFTTMGTTSFQFKESDYKQVKAHLNGVVIEQ